MMKVILILNLLLSFTVFSQETSIDTESLDLSTVSGRADYARHLYYTFNGDPSGVGAEMAFINMINNLIQSLGSEISNAGYETCEDIPTEGTGVIFGSNVQFQAGYAAIPSHFPSNAGETYDRRIVFLAADNSVENVAELSCGDGAQSGFLYLTAEGEQNSFQVTYQIDSASSSTYLDALISFGDGKNFMRFETTDGETFNLVIMNAGQGNTATSVTGTAGGNVLVNFGFVVDANASSILSTEVTDFSGASSDSSQFVGSDCVNITTKEVATGCTTIEAGQTFSANGENVALTMQALSDLTIIAPEVNPERTNSGNNNSESTDSQ